MRLHRSLIVLILANAPAAARALPLCTHEQAAPVLAQLEHPEPEVASEVKRSSDALRELAPKLLGAAASGDKAQLAAMNQSLFEETGRMKVAVERALRPVTQLKTRCQLDAGDPDQKKMLAISERFEKNSAHWEAQRKIMEKLPHHDAQSAAGVPAAPTTGEASLAPRSGAAHEHPLDAILEELNTKKGAAKQGASRPCTLPDMERIKSSLSEITDKGQKVRVLMSQATEKIQEILRGAAATQGDPGKRMEVRQKILGLDSAIGRVTGDYFKGTDDVRHAMLQCKLPDVPNAAHLKSSYEAFESSTKTMHEDVKVYREKLAAIDAKLQ
jgi:hypothetical protein